MKHYGKLDTCPFRGPVFINKKAPGEEILQKNHKNGSPPKGFNKSTDTSNTDSHKAKIARHWPKVNSVHFEDPYYRINPMYNTHDDTHIIDTHEEHNGEYSDEK